MENNQKSVNIKLNKKFYNIISVKESLMAFLDICGVKLEDTSDYYLVTLYPRDRETKAMINGEFSNYVLTLMKNKFQV